MNKKLMKVALASFIAASTVNVNAAGLTSAGTISSINAGSQSVQVRGSFTGNPDSCTDTDAYILEKEGNADFKDFYAALLTAYAAGNSLRLFVDGCVDNPAATKNRASIGSLLLQ